MDCWNGGRVKNKIKKYDIPNISQPILSIVMYYLLYAVLNHVMKSFMVT